MKIIAPSITPVTDFVGVSSFFKAVARAARICYASNKTDDETTLAKSLIQRKHYSPFAHAILCLKRPSYSFNLRCIYENIRLNRYTVSKQETGRDYFCVHGWVVIDSIIEFIKENELEFVYVENDMIAVHPDRIFYWLMSFIADIVQNDLSVINQDTFYSFIADTNIGTSREMLVHKGSARFYMCEQSTRYCDFTKDKFGGLQVNEPYWYADADEQKKARWCDFMKYNETVYRNFRKEDNAPTDDARGILPLDTHTRCIWTATKAEWINILCKRCYNETGKAHGDIHRIAGMIAEQIYQIKH